MTVGQSEPSRTKAERRVDRISAELRALRAVPVRDRTTEHLRRLSELEAALPVAWRAVNQTREQLNQRRLMR